jgi:hypothetical protein
MAEPLPVEYAPSRLVRGSTSLNQKSTQPIREPAFESVVRILPAPLDRDLVGLQLCHRRARFLWPRAVQRFMESPNRSNSLFLRNSGRKTVTHFSWNCSSRLLKKC